MLPIDRLIDIAREAGDEILRCRDHLNNDVSTKADGTPVTLADVRADALIRRKLQALSSLPMLSEESDLPAFTVRRHWGEYWMIDPLDGTRGYINGLDDFTVNIAFIQSHTPVLGVIYVPCMDCSYYAIQGEGAYRIQHASGSFVKERISVLAHPIEELRILTGHFHNPQSIAPLVNRYPRLQVRRQNSSLKFCKIAQGDADLYIRRGPINEWDVAAGHCILAEAGGVVVDFDRASLHYNAAESLSCYPFMALSDVQLADSILTLIT